MAISLKRKKYIKNKFYLIYKSKRESEREIDRETKSQKENGKGFKKKKM